ncbi:uncharacterized protein LOC109950306 [Prunus persica]|uniref:uncharacterized protein LOC109950306 n=1 Tax=Prunus persica TaxID=3760 RepID=UPI0009AB7A39|nr:uncharacterized protein LOC109950306 [Prunus persica]
MTSGNDTHKQSSTQTSTSTTATPITTTATLTQTNLAHSQWYQQDQLIVSYITSTLSESILSLTVGYTSALDLWECLQHHFFQSSMASESALRFQLMDLQKGSQPIDSYLRHAKSLADSLDVINEPVSSKELITSVLQSLGHDYKMLVTAILNFPPLPQFADLRACLLAFDAQALRISLDQNTVLMATQSSPHSAGHTSFPSHRGGGSSSNRRGGRSR